MKEVLERKAIDFIHSKKDIPLMIVDNVVDSCQTKIKEALFEELVCSFNVQDIETITLWAAQLRFGSRLDIIKVIKSIETDERSSFMMEIIQKHETARNCQDVFLWLSTMFPVSINVTAVGDRNIIADEYSEVLGVYDRESSFINGYPAYRQKADLELQHVISIGTEKTWSITGVNDGWMLKLQSNIRTDQIRPVSFCLWINEEIGVCQASSEDLMETNHSQSQGLPFFKISSNIPSPCKITITATGTAAEVAADYLGSYVSTEEWSEGRRTFKPEERGENNERLQVEYGRWGFRGVENGFKIGCAPSLCPADPRVPRKYTTYLNGYNGQTFGWVFTARTDELGGWENEEGGIVVSCSVHNHNDQEFEEELGRLVAAEEARVAAEVAASMEM